MRLGLLLLLLLSGPANAVLRAAPQPPKAVPAYRIPLAPLGYRPVRSVMLLQNSIVPNTLDFVDADHVLVTFGVHKLVPRDSGDAEGDRDRFIKAVLLHLPDGAVVREAEWRMHDTGRYLWPLSHGRFLLRIRNELFWVDPQRPHATMHRHTLLKPDAEVVAIQVSPDGATLLVQTQPKRQIGDDPTVPDTRRVTATLYRITEDEHPEAKQFYRTETEQPFALSFTSRGFLKTVQEDRQHWGFDFVPFIGNKIELAGLTSLCRPEAHFVSEATFIATGCQGSYEKTDRRLLSGFDLLAQANWVFTTDDPPLWAAISAVSGDSGRFAFRNTQDPLSSSNDEDERSDRHRQWVRVYEFQSGKELLRVVLTPAQRGGINFDLSPDGLKLALLQDDALEVYTLPPLSPENRREQAREAQVLETLRLPDPDKHKQDRENVLRLEGDPARAPQD